MHSTPIEAHLDCLSAVEVKYFIRRHYTGESPSDAMVFSQSRLLPNRSPVAWGSQRIALGALIFHSNTLHFICWAPKFSAFSSEGPFKIFLGSSLVNASIMIQNLRAHCPMVKQVWLAEDSAGGGRIAQLFDWYKQMSKEGEMFGYLVNWSKSWLIVKSEALADEAKRVFGDEVNITTEGQCHLGAVIAS